MVNEHYNHQYLSTHHYLSQACGHHTSFSTIFWKNSFIIIFMMECECEKAKIWWKQQPRRRGENLENGGHLSNFEFLHLLVLQPRLYLPQLNCFHSSVVMPQYHSGQPHSAQLNYKFHMSWKWQMTVRYWRRKWNLDYLLSPIILTKGQILTSIKRRKSQRWHSK